jgi:uncharacterized protein (TIGR00255 family)
MKSMTGFAYTERQTDSGAVTVEIKGYNSRFLDMSVGLSPALSPLEPRIRSIVSDCCKRGKIDVSVRETNRDAPVYVTVNAEAVRAYLAAADTVKSLLPASVGETLPLADILCLDGVLEIEKGRLREEAAWEGVKDVFLETLQKFDAEREREGRHTEENILSYITIIEEQRDIVASLLPRVEQTIKDNIKSRLAELAADNVDENRILAETALLLMRYTIAEEISRLSSHLAEFRAETARGSAAGKKLDFLSQEINREINTIGSKTPLVETSRAVVAMKDALENIREQLRNVE